MNIKKLIKELEETLAEYSPETLALFNPPLPKNEVVAFFDKLGVYDENLIELYTWRNGYKSTNSFHEDLWPLVGRFISLDSIIGHIELNESLREEEAAYSDDLICFFCLSSEEYLFCKAKGLTMGKYFFMTQH